MSTIRKVRARDAYWQRFLKYPRLTRFASRIELLHAALLEGDPGVSAFVPHPFQLSAASKSDIPGCYLLRDGMRVVQAIGSLSTESQQSLREFFASHGMRFEMVADETIISREIEARNWLHIVRRLVEAEGLDTASRESALLRRMRAHHAMTFAELTGHRNHDEIALFRLLHRGVLRAQLDRNALNPHTRLLLPR